MDLNFDPALSNSGILHNRKQSQSESERMDGFVMVTPQSEIASWATMSTDAVGGVSQTPTSLAPSQLMQTKNSNTWMGADLDAHDIGHLATVHFPELRDITGSGDGSGDGMSGLNGHGQVGGNGNSHLDFMNLGGDEWKDWQPNHTNGTGELDGFPPVSSFAAAFSPGKFGDQGISVGFGEGN